MKIIKEFEKARMDKEQEERLKKEDILYTSYIRCREAGNEILNLAFPIWEEQVDRIIESCLKHGVKEITLSCWWRSTLTSIKGFEDRGCKIKAVGYVKDIIDMRVSGEYERVPAVVLAIRKRKPAKRDTGKEEPKG